MEAIILAGGLGTRLKGVIGEIPKPMAPVNGVPFLEILLNKLKIYKFQRIVLSVGYKHEVIQQYFGDWFEGIELVYSIESQPLGTGGAIRNSLRECTTDDVFVINGDTFFDCDFDEMLNFHQNKESRLTIAVKQMVDFDRYGVVKFDQAMRIQEFREKKFYHEGYINGGIYLLNKVVSKSMFPDREKFSFEKEVLESLVSKQNFLACPQKGDFIDIGIPEDYEKVQTMF